MYICPSCSIIFSCGNLGALIQLKMTPFLLDSIGIHGMFVSFAAVVAIAFFYHLMLMKETRGFSLKEIQEFYKSIAKAEDGKSITE